MHHTYNFALFEALASYPLNLVLIHTFEMRTSGGETAFGIMMSLICQTILGAMSIIILSKKCNKRVIQTVTPPINNIADIPMTEPSTSIRVESLYEWSVTRNDSIAPMQTV